MAKELNLKIIPKPKSKASFKSNVLVLFSVILFISCLAVFVVFSFFINPSLTDKKNGLFQSIILLDNPANMKVANELVAASNKINDFDFLWQNHKISSNLFGFLQSICHKKVQMQSVNFGIENEKANISFQAITDDFKTLGEQLIFLKQDERIIVFNVGGVSLSSKEILFNISMQVAVDMFLDKSNN